MIVKYNSPTGTPISIDTRTIDYGDFWSALLFNLDEVLAANGVINAYHGLEKDSKRNVVFLQRREKHQRSESKVTSPPP